MVVCAVDLIMTRALTQNGHKYLWGETRRVALLIAAAHLTAHWRLIPHLLIMWRRTPIFLSTDDTALRNI